VRTWRAVGLVLVLALAALAPAHAADAVARLRQHVEFLASPDLEGRLTGSEGERRAAQYLIRELRGIGAVPLPGADGYESTFEFTAGTRDLGSSVVLVPASEAAVAWQGLDRVRALSFSDTGRVQGEVVFAGYGLTLPEGPGLAYDSYAGLDVRDKIVLVLRYAPEDADEELRAELTRYSGLRYKALQARERGAKALLVVTGPRSPNAGATVESQFDAALAGSGILAASIGGAVGDRLLAGVEGGLERVQRELDTGNPHVTGFPLAGLTLALDVKIERERRTGRNIVGLLPARGDERAPLVMLGAHYDHLGRGRHGNSRAAAEEVGQIHHGADDNASGVAAILEAGRRIAERERRGPVALAFWSGEELGLLGSSAYVKAPPGTLGLPAAYLNFDMVGRMRDNRLNLQGVGSSPVWGELIEQANVVVGFDVRTQADPYLPTDASVLYQSGVPIASFFTGNHDDYHRPSDRAAAVNYADLDRVARFATVIALAVGQLPAPPGYVKVERTRASSGDRDGLRAYTGTIPDYATEVHGLRLSGVVGGGPAEQAGLRAGDVIVEFAGRAIANVYDYTYALGSVKVDQPVRVVCLRDGERLEFTVTPTARP
jgi:hypothetical protein